VPVLKPTAVSATAIYNLVHQNFIGSKFSLVIQVISYALLHEIPFITAEMSASRSTPTLIAPVPDYKAFRRTCCCCIPARAGVIFFGLLGLFGGGAVSATAIYNLVHQNFIGSKFSLVIQVISYVLLTLVSLVGLVGAFAQKHVCVKAFFIILILHLLASIGTGIYAIRLLFLEQSEYSEQCVGTSDDPDVATGCRKSFTLLKIFVVAVYVTAWLIEVWASTVVYNYMKQLSDEEKARKALKASETW
jgi:hypothetical protein